MKGSVYKKLVSTLVSVTVIISIASSIPVNADMSEESYNYAEALQLSMYLYDANKCGVGVTGGLLDWRGDCHTYDAKVPLQSVENGGGAKMPPAYIAEHIDVFDPDGDGCMDLSGGYHDAGDHVKFGLPQSYSGSTLGWSYYEFRDSFIKIGEQEHIEDILRWFNDYFIKCTFRDDNGEVIAFCYQVGDGANDHNYWGPPELQTTARPALFATPMGPASDQTAGAAASLAVNYLNFKDTDIEYAEKSLDTAIALYEFSQKYRALGTSGGFYNSSYDDDELSWAAVWLYLATGDWEYIDDIISVDNNGIYTGYMKRIISTTANTWQNIWVHSWDTVWGGVFAKLAPITNDKNHWYFFRWNCEYWSGVPHADSADKSYLNPTPGGFRVLNTWGSARYNAAAQLCCLVYNKYDKEPGFVDWCKSQMDYILGDNPLNRCYEVGYSENSVKNPHHRAAHSSTTNSMLDPEVQRHVLWGALVGGPDTDDKHNDVTTDYVYNEVAIDYNAGFVGALAGIYELFGEGQQPRENFPPDSEPELALYSTAKIEQESNERTQVTIKVHNESFQPAEYQNNMKVRYFFNISEMIIAGQSIDDIDVQIMYDQAKNKDGINTIVSEPIAYDKENGIYYIEIDWSKIALHGFREIHIGLIASQDSGFNAHWDKNNDWSRTGLSPDEEHISEYIPVYLGDELVFGKEPTADGMGLKSEIIEPYDNAEFDFREEITPITVKAEAGCSTEDISKVELFENGIKIAEDTEAPYEFEFLPDNTGMDVDGKKIISITVNAITVNGYKITSSPKNIKISFSPATEPIIQIVNPVANEIIDATEGRIIVPVQANVIGFTEEVEEVLIYADGELIGSSKGISCLAYYETPDKEGPSPDGIITVPITAKAKLKDGTVITAKEVNLKVKLKYTLSAVDSLKISISKGTDTNANSIGYEMRLTNTGNSNIDLSKVTIKYFYTKDMNLSQIFSCDFAGINLSSAPFFAGVTTSVGGVIYDTEKTYNADTYLEISLKSIQYTLSSGKEMTIAFRITNSDWMPYNQLNDFSYKNAENIAIYYEGKLIKGNEPF